MSQKKIIFYCLSIISAFLLVSCANPVTPEGGPKDVKPPLVLNCEPANRTVKFNNNSIRIVFDEFINLKNPLSEIFISPPLKDRLEPKLRGKSLLIKITDTLAAVTTYSISFGNAISDITENNILKDFTYVFSTGDFIDSLSLRGTLVSAFDHVPQKDIFAELYINNNDTLPIDSLPLKVPPYYVTKTDEKGNFIFNNLKKNDFLLFALSDQNGDLIFNQPSEKIAFSDTLVKPYYIALPKIDSTKKDTLKIIKPNESSPKKLDSIRISDSIKKIDSLKKMDMLYPSYTLSLFEEIDSGQRLLNSRFPREGVAMLIFRYPVHDLHIVPLNFDSLSAWRVDEYSPKRDTVFLWLTHPKIDSLIARIVVDRKLIDTLRLNLVKKQAPRKNEKKTIGTQLGFQNSASGAGFNQFKNKVELTASYPLARWDLSRVLLTEDKDTLKANLEFFDSIKRHLVVNHKWKEETTYTLLIPDSVFFSVTGFSHDSIIQTFRSKAERDFGNLIVTMNIDQQPGQYIIQLLNEKETSIIEEHIITQSGKIKMNYLNPGQFKLKAIFDRNKNGRWDTGKYRSRIQPEKVFYFPKNIEIRSNWDVEENWVL